MEHIAPESAEQNAEPYDLLVIGGGINGVGVARDAAGRGLSVLLCERDDLSGATSSASSKLLHGGLRYLEQFQFRMVRHALAEREILLNAAPHVVRPLRFALPHNPAVRRYWTVRIGVWLYDHLARRDILPASTPLDFRTGDEAPLASRFAKGFEYSDCWVDDARLVILTAVDAGNRGARIMSRTECTAARWDGRQWTVRLRDTISGETCTAQARCIVNAAGPWAEPVSRNVLGVEPAYRTRPVKGSHIVVPQLFDDKRAFILQNDDRRIVFVLPFEDNFTLIGTTDVPFDGEPGGAAIDAQEIAYLCRVASDHFITPVSPDDIVWTFSGVRPLFDDGASSPSSISRDYQLEEHPSKDNAGIRALTIWGGKLTGYRTLAEDVLARLQATFPEMGGPWTAGATLPGGNLNPAGLDRFSRMVSQVYDWLPARLARAYAHRYGALVHSMLGNANSLQSLGPEITPGLYHREVEYLIRNEWARTADDILWRRTKIGLHASASDHEKLAAYLAGSFE